MGKASQRVDFVVEEFDKTIKEKGYHLLHEKAYRCPCVNDSGELQITCPHCHGKGIRYVGDAARIEGILTSMSKDWMFDEYGVSSTGTVYVTTHAKYKLGFADRLTLLDGKIVFSEVIENLNTIPVLKYPIIDVDSIVSFNKVYVENTDYSLANGVITWLKPVHEAYSIRYITYPTFIILNFPNVVRGTQAKVKQPVIRYVDLPVRALAKLEFKVKVAELQ